MDCAYCKHPINGECLKILETKVQIGRFINKKIVLLKKDDCLCKDCLQGDRKEIK